MPRCYKELRELFNTSAAKYEGGDSEMLLMRFHLLLRHKAETDEDRAQLVGTLYQTGTRVMKQFTDASNRGWLPSGTAKGIEDIFEALAKPESEKHVPAAAASELADISFDLLAAAEKLTYNDFGNYTNYTEYRTAVMSFAKTAMKGADTFADAAEQRYIDITTSKNITPAKRLQVKPVEPPIP